MADLPIWQIIIMFFTSGGAIFGIVHLLNAVWSRLDKARRIRAQKAEHHLSETNQKDAITLKGLEFTQSGFINLIERLEDEINSQRTTIRELRNEIQECEANREEVLIELNEVKVKLRLIEASLKNKQ